MAATSAVLVGSQDKSRNVMEIHNYTECEWNLYRVSYQVYPAQQSLVAQCSLLGGGEFRIQLKINRVICLHL